MTSKFKRAKGKKAGWRTERIARLRASVSVEDELLRLAEEDAGGGWVTVEPSAQAKNLPARGLRGRGLV